MVGDNYLEYLDLQVGDCSYHIERPRLKHWLYLEEIRRQTNSGKLEIYEGIVDYLKLFHPFSKPFWEDLFWMETISIFNKILQFMDPPYSFPFMKTLKENENEEIIPWDYPERDWYSLAHLIMSEYSWSLEYVAELHIKDALALLQEIALDQQFKREWEWVRCDIAYPYNPSTKRKEYKALDRPAWMMRSVEIKRIKIPKSLFPIGNVIDTGGMQRIIDENKDQS